MVIFIIVRKMYNCETCSSEYAERAILQSVTKYNEYVQSTSDIFERIPSGLERQEIESGSEGSRIQRAEKSGT